MKRTENTSKRRSSISIGSDENVTTAKKESIRRNSSNLVTDNKTIMAEDTTRRRSSINLGSFSKAVMVENTTRRRSSISSRKDIILSSKKASRRRSSINHDFISGYDESHSTSSYDSDFTGTTVVGSNGYPHDNILHSKSTLCAVQKIWIHCTELLRQTMTKVVVELAVKSAANPKITLVSLTSLSLLLLGLGFVINFDLKLDLNEILAPINSHPLRHSNWITNQEESGFHKTHPYLMYVHADGSNVLGTASTTTANVTTTTTITTSTGTTTTTSEITKEEKVVPLIVEALRAAFNTIDAVRNTPGYNELCKLGNYYHYNGEEKEKTCRILSITKMWDHNREKFEKELAFYQKLQTNNYNWLLDKLSADYFPDMTPIFHEGVIGRAIWIEEPAAVLSNSKGSNNIGNNTITETQTQTRGRTLVSAKSFMMIIELPLEPNSEKQHWQFQISALQWLAKLKNDILENKIRINSSNDNNDSNGEDDVDNGNKNNIVRIDYFSDYASLQVEFMKAIYQDISLLPLVVAVTVGFTCLIFLNPKDPVKSRCLVGIGSVITIAMGLMNAFGIMFLFGVPFTQLTQVLPCVVFGVGLDDTFIITGEYYTRLAEKNKNSSSVADTDADIIDRVAKTIEEVGISIFLTTTTTIVAFLLGVFSSTIPGVIWLCIYGTAAILIDFLYQITYFVAFLVLNERRVRDNKLDCCFCIQVSLDDEVDDCDDNTSLQPHMKKDAEGKKKIESMGKEGDAIKDRDSKKRGNNSKKQKYDEEAAVDEVPSSNVQKQVGEQSRLVQRIMSWYADQLLRPRCKRFVIFFFLAMTAYNTYSVSLFRQEFEIEDYLPTGSDMKGWLHATSKYTSVVRTIGVYFRDIDQADPVVQTEMIKYIDDLTENLKHVGGQPPAACWFRDLQMLLEGNMTVPKDVALPPGAAAAVPSDVDFLKRMTINQQVKYVLSNPLMQEIYGSDIAFANDENGESYIKSSRCYFIVREMDFNAVKDQMDLLIDQRAITASQSINVGDGIKTDWSMFSFDQMYLFWEMYLVAVNELFFTIVTGIVAVGCVTFLLVPHRSALAVVMPMMVVLYINFLGMVRLVGIHINAFMYILVVVSIGLLVDFLMHILMRYYELQHNNVLVLGLPLSPDDCVKKALETMGASVLQGGLTTFLAVLCLVFSTTEFFVIGFRALSIMIIVGIIHGLVLLPVVLSILGPTATVSKRDSLFYGVQKRSSLAKVECLTEF